MAMRGSVGMESDQGVAVMALVFEVEVREVERRPAIALGDNDAAGREHGGERSRELVGEPRSVPVWRTEEDEMVLVGGGSQEPRRAAAVDVRASRLRKVGFHRCDGPGVVVDEGGTRGAPAQRLDAERARAGEEVEHVSARYSG